MGSPKRDSLATREQQIMEAIHRIGEASVRDVLAELPDPPSYSAVRTMIRHLESKGHLRHRQTGRSYVYRATESRTTARRSALRKLLDVFFDRSPSNAVAAILELNAQPLDPAELDRIEQLIQRARREGK